MQWVLCVKNLWLDKCVKFCDEYSKPCYIGTKICFICIGIKLCNKVQKTLQRLTWLSKVV